MGTMVISWTVVFLVHILLTTGQTTVSPQTLAPADAQDEVIPSVLPLTPTSGLSVTELSHSSPAPVSEPSNTEFLQASTARPSANTAVSNDTASPPAVTLSSEQLGSTTGPSKETLTPTASTDYSTVLPPVKSSTAPVFTMTPDLTKTPVFTMTPVFTTAPEMPVSTAGDNETVPSPHTVHISLGTQASPSPSPVPTTIFTTELAQTSAPGPTQHDTPSELDVGDDDSAEVPHQPNSPLDPILAGLVSVFIVCTAMASVLLFLRFRQRNGNPEFHRLQDLPMDDLMEDTPLSRYTY